ncbi:LacI family DNA-binding transcriptional regulator [Ruicaihuangia caeni]|uniref:LacI family DNA-binding transcriptional regulator n=1 Tax=Ruicaihuangia caeni TaxID=3042517 RepID=A0AAW6T8E2_9MICO|nr:LacI family DNA-binding transcriptional regulator [Klugiella sp. YN-L-19]MDI2098365.1 LacI family DNA-binding transcriptional regulator [Klugiella sp. YN-L-19]
MNPRRPTIKDVAREAGVSVATASEALNGKGRVAPATRQNVIEVAERLHYTPSRTAKNLNAGRTGTIALAVSPMSGGGGAGSLQPEWDVEYYFRVLNGASARAFTKGFLLSMIPFHGTSHGFLNSTDGLIVVDPGADDDLVDQAVRRGIACVTIGRNSREVSWVDNDFFTGTTQSLDHLSARSPALFLSETTSSYVRDELSAYLEWCAAANANPTIIRSPGPLVDEAEPVISAALSADDRQFDAVVTTLDTLAIATERSARQLGIDVPERLQILSLADSRYLHFGLQRSITALDLHPVRLGELAVELLVSQIEGDRERRQELLPTSLTIRESTNATPAR